MKLDFFKNWLTDPFTYILCLMLGFCIEQQLLPLWFFLGFLGAIIWFRYTLFYGKPALGGILASVLS